MCVCMCVRVHVCKCVSSVRVIAQSLEASGGHAQFQLASLPKVHKHILGLKKTRKKTRRCKRVLVNLIYALRGAAVFPLERLSELAITWECGETFEGLVRENLSSCDQHVFQIRNFTKMHGDSPAHIKTRGYAHTTPLFCFATHNNARNKV